MGPDRWRGADWRRSLRTLGLGLVLLCAALAALASEAPPAAAETGDDARHYIILAVEDRGDPLPGAGGAPRGDYRRMAGYAGSVKASALAERVAQDYRLRERAAWTIAQLNLRCALYALAPGENREDVLARLREDRRVELAQPLNEFETLALPPAPTPSPTSAPAAATQSGYNDPYFRLQKGFQQMAVAPLQQLSLGARVKVAVIDTGMDTRHPDLTGRLTSQRDYVAGGGAYVDAVAERHGTAVLGLIAAKVNNGQGIAGLAPEAAMLGYRACWAETLRSDAAAPGARCNSFTLAQALAAAITDGADIINLSLGGPSDPLLGKLVRHAQSRGALLVAAAPPPRLGRGFPSELPGVLVVASMGEATEAEDWLVAPGRAVLSTMPGGSYDLDSGSSLAAAHTSGVLALLKALAPGLGADRLRRALQSSTAGPGQPINACRAALALGVAGLSCEAASLTR